MTRRMLTLAAGFLFLSSIGWACAGLDQRDSRTSKPFDRALVHFEQNVTDEDFVAVFEAKGGSEGLTRFTLVDPDGRTIIDVKPPEAATLGIRQVRLESLRTMDAKSLKSAYPEGAYTFAGITPSGAQLQDKVMLSHTLPATVSLLRPEPGAEGLGTRNIKVSWTAVKDAAGYIISIEQDELKAYLNVRVPASVTTLTVPDSFLSRGKQYQLTIGTVNEGGNISFVYSWFTTAE